MNRNPNNGPHHPPGRNHPGQNFTGNSASGRGLVINGGVNGNIRGGLGNYDSHNIDSHDTIYMMQRNNQGPAWVSRLSPAQLGPALVDAARAGETDQIEIFIKRGANPNHTHPHHGTALLQAVIHQHHHCVDHLLKRGALATHQNAQGRCALDIAVRNNDLNTIKIFVKHEVDLDHHGSGADSALRTAARHGLLPILDLLLEGGASTEKVRAPNGPTALLIAIANGHFGCAESLVRHRANIHSRCRQYDNVSALALAAAKNHCQFLLNAGAKQDLEIQDMNGQTPLFYAIAKGKGHNVPAIELLLKYGARTSHGSQTALDCAHRHGFRDIVLTLERHERAMRPVALRQNIQQRPPPQPTYSQGTLHRTLPPQNNYSSISAGNHRQPERPPLRQPQHSSRLGSRHQGSTF